jgi:hypothetical protein
MLVPTPLILLGTSPPCTLDPIKKKDVEPGRLLSTQFSQLPADAQPIATDGVAYEILGLAKD